jgi:hypothetical protein
MNAILPRGLQAVYRTLMPGRRKKSDGLELDEGMCVELPHPAIILPIEIASQT